MAGRNPPEAVQAYLDPLQKALACVTRAVLNVGGGYHPSPSPHVLMIGDGGSLELGRGSELLLSVKQHYRIVEDPGPRGPWKVTVVGYLYALGDATSGLEIVAYHWHPTERSTVTVPHLHLGPAAQVARQALTRAHLPTGRIAVEEVIRLAVRDLGAHPLRDDWAEVLDSTQAGYDEWRT